MLLGLVSDTHDRLEMIQKAVKFFNSQKLDYVLHAGDYVAPFTAAHFSQLQIPMIGVFGNNDGEKKGLTEVYAPFAQIHESPYVFELKGYKIALMHSPVKLEEHIKNSRVIIHGHTHTVEIKHMQDKVLINPGECCGYLHGRSTIAVVDVKTLKVSLTEL